MRWPIHPLVGPSLLALALGFTPLAMADVVPPSSFSVSFGTPSDLAAPCVRVGSSADQHCSKTLTLDNGALDGTAKLRVDAQASADTSEHYGSYIASASIDIEYWVPFVVTRTVEVASVGGQYVAVVPELSLNFNCDYAAVAATRDEVGTGQERADVGPLTITLSSSTPWSVSGVGQSGTTGAPSFNTISQTTRRVITLDLGASVGEVGTLADIPLTMNLWNDESAPFVDYGTRHCAVEAGRPGRVAGWAQASARSPG